MDSPRFIHDCDSCTFLGCREIRGQSADCYYCEHCDEGSVIARYSSKPSDYASMGFIREWMTADNEARYPEWAMEIRAMRFGYPQPHINPFSDLSIRHNGRCPEWAWEQLSEYVQR